MLIGLHGKKQAGKDTVHQRIEHLLGRSSQTGATVERVSFADLLYESAAAALGVGVDFLREWKSDPDAGVRLYDGHANVYAEFTFRQFLQWYGTEAHRNLFGDNFWVDNVNLREHDRKIVVVTDVRFRNEAEAVLRAGGSVVHVMGPSTGEHDGHESEKPLPAFLVDHAIDNSARDDGFRALDEQVLDLVLTLAREESRLRSEVSRP